MDDLAVISGWDLRDGQQCGARLHRRLGGSRGQFTGNARFAVLMRLRADIAVAHTELRAPTPADFPAPTDLEAEQVAVYRAAANGYLALFGNQPARRMEWETARELPELGYSFRPAVGVVLADEHDRITVRRCMASGRVPNLDDALIYSMAIVWEHYLRGAQCDLVVADTIALETKEATFVIDDVIDAAWEWLHTRVAAVEALAAANQAVTGTECADCSYIWDCPVHAMARRR